MEQFIQIQEQVTAFGTYQSDVVWISASREEIDVTLQVLRGELPLDLQGHILVNSSVGSVNSRGLPFPATMPDGKHNQEEGSPIFNGDGMMYRFDMSKPGRVRLKTRLMKTPCFYADHATRYGSPLHRKYGFRNMGLIRMSMQLGTRNQLNTASLPVRFEGDLAPRLLATYDAGRPYEIDPQTLSLKTPVGSNAEWLMSEIPFVKHPFPVIQSTAHPVFDPSTREFFSVNYLKSSKSMLASVKLLELLTGDEKSHDETNPHHYEQMRDKVKMMEVLNYLIRNIDIKLRRKKSKRSRLLHWMLSPLFPNKENTKRRTSQKMLLHMLIKQLRFMTKKDHSDAVYLVQWQGKAELKKWKVVDEHNCPIAILHCIHQVGISRDYIILADASFNMSVDIMFNNPFPNNPHIECLMRDLTSMPMEPFTPLYIVKRSELQDNSYVVRAKRVNLNIEAIHFSADYDNPDNQVTLYMAHNSAACIAEWVRLYDTRASNPEQPVDPAVVGLMTGAMDIGRIGKFVIDADKGEIISKNVIFETGRADTPEDVGPHTWGIGLYTYRDMYSLDALPRRIKNIYWQCYGLNDRLLTGFIYDLYKDYPNRIVPVEDVLKYTQQGIPYTICRLNTTSMKLEDCYQFPVDSLCRSIEFVPRKRETPLPPHVDESKDGYIFCTVINGTTDPEQERERCEIWVFDAAYLKRGPVCVLSHPKFNFAFSLHSSWMAEARETAASYCIPVREDYEEVIRKIHPSGKRKDIQELFEHHIYPHF